MLKITNLGHKAIDILVANPDKGIKDSYTIYTQYSFFIRNSLIKNIQNIEELAESDDLRIVADDIQNLPDAVIPYYRSDKNLLNEVLQIFGVCPHLGISDQHNCAVTPARIGNSLPIPYNNIDGKPQINGVTLRSGNNESEDLGLVKHTNTGLGLAEGGEGLTDYNFTSGDKAKLNAFSLDDMKALAGLNLSKYQEREKIPGLDRFRVLSDNNLTDDLHDRLINFPKVDQIYNDQTLQYILEGNDDEVRTYGRTCKNVARITLDVIGGVYGKGDILTLTSNDCIELHPVRIEVLGIDVNGVPTEIALVDKGTFLTVNDSVKFTHTKNGAVTEFTAIMVPDPKHPFNQMQGKITKEWAKNIPLTTGMKLVHSDTDTYLLTLQMLNIVSGKEAEDLEVKLPLSGFDEEDKPYGGLMSAEQVQKLKDAIVGADIDNKFDRVNLDALTVEHTEFTENGYEVKLSSVNLSTGETVDIPAFTIPFAKTGSRIGEPDLDGNEDGGTPGLLTEDDYETLDALRRGDVLISTTRESMEYNLLDFDPSDYTTNAHGGLIAYLRPAFDPVTGLLNLYKYNNSNPFFSACINKAITTKLSEIKLNTTDFESGIRKLDLYGDTWDDEAKRILTNEDPINSITLPKIEGTDRVKISHTSDADIIDVALNNDYTNFSTSENGIALEPATVSLIGGLKSSKDIFDISVTSSGIAHVNGIEDALAEKLNKKIADKPDRVLVTDPTGDIVTSDVPHKDLQTILGMSSLSEMLGIEGNVTPAQVLQTLYEDSVNFINTDDSQTDTENLIVDLYTQGHKFGESSYKRQAKLIKVTETHAGVMSSDMYKKLAALKTAEEYDAVEALLNETISKLEIEIKRAIDADAKLTTDLTGNTASLQAEIDNLHDTLDEQVAELKGSLGTGFDNIATDINKVEDKIDNFISEQTVTNADVQDKLAELDTKIYEETQRSISNLDKKLDKNLTIDNGNGILVTDNDGNVTVNRDISNRELSTLDNIDTGTTIQKQLDNKVSKTDLLTVVRDIDPEVLVNTEEVGFQSYLYNTVTGETITRKVMLPSAKNTEDKKFAGLMSYEDKRILDELYSYKDIILNSVQYDDVGLKNQRLVVADVSATNASNGVFIEQEVRDLDKKETTLKNVIQIPHASDLAPADKGRMGLISGIDFDYFDRITKFSRFTNDTVLGRQKLTVNETKDTLTITNEYVGVLDDANHKKNIVNIKAGHGIVLDIEKKDGEVDEDEEDIISKVIVRATCEIPNLPEDFEDGRYSLTAIKSGSEIKYEWVVEELADENFVSFLDW